VELSAFIKKIEKLNVDRSKGLPAPHKAILLLSIIESIERGEIKENRIYITSDLVGRFKSNWCSFDIDSRFNPNFALPFFHLRSDGFWKLQTKPGMELLLTSSHSVRSFGSLRETLEFAYFTSEVYLLLQVPENRAIIKDVLMSRYLGRPSRPYDLFHVLEEKMLNETPAEYRREIDHADEEDVFVRCGVFAKVVPRVYNYTCCISGLRISTARDVQMVDACHIIPFAESHNDTISNGLSLSPNLHRAFDRFLITVDEDYRVVVSKNFNEAGQHSIRQFHGKKLLLPADIKYTPSQESLSWHRDRFASVN